MRNEKLNLEYDVIQPKNRFHKELKVITGELDPYENLKKPFVRELIEFIIYIGLVICSCLLILQNVAVFSLVVGSSMNPNFSDRDALIVEKISYAKGDPQRFDVIVFELKNEPGVHYIKRIIGLPGETVQVKDGAAYINGEKLETDIYGKEPMQQAYSAAIPITLGKDEYFVLGDNRNNSKDSRSSALGPIRREQFLGKVLLRFWPIWEFRLFTTS